MIGFCTHFAPLFYWYFNDPLIVSIFLKDFLSILIFSELPYRYRYWYFPEMSYQYRYRYFQKWPYRYRYFAKVLIYRQSIFDFDISNRARRRYNQWQSSSHPPPLPVRLCQKKNLHPLPSFLSGARLSGFSSPVTISLPDVLFSLFALLCRMLRLLFHLSPNFIRHLCSICLDCSLETDCTFCN